MKRTFYSGVHSEVLFQIVLEEDSKGWVEMLGSIYGIMEQEVLLDKDEHWESRHVGCLSAPYIH